MKQWKNKLRTAIINTVFVLVLSRFKVLVLSREVLGINEMLIVNPRLIYSICFLDECTFSSTETGLMSILDNFVRFILRTLRNWMCGLKSLAAPWLICSFCLKIWKEICISGSFGERYRITEIIGKPNHWEQNGAAVYFRLMEWNEGTLY